MKEHLLCPDCQSDLQTACPRDVDGQCLECGAKLCAHHLMIHFKKVHCISIEWRGMQKAPDEEKCHEPDEEGF